MLATEANRRRIDDRQQLLEIPNQQRIEQNFVAVLQAAKKDVAFEVVWQLPQRLKATRNLFIECGDRRRQKTVEVEQVAFVLGERGPLVQQRAIDEIIAASRG